MTPIQTEIFKAATVIWSRRETGCDQAVEIYIETLNGTVGWMAAPPRTTWQKMKAFWIWLRYERK